jgi:hypothetical protein
MNNTEWFFTDDFQICRQRHKGVFEFVEFNQVDDLMIQSEDKIIVANYKDSDGEWDADAISCITGFYKDLDELKRNYPDEESQNQVVAECIFESSSQFNSDSLTLSENEARKWLEDIVNGKVDYEV